jgi:hypothetical protein
MGDEDPTGVEGNFIVGSLQRDGALAKDAH